MLHKRFSEEQIIPVFKKQGTVFFLVKNYHERHKTSFDAFQKFVY